MNRIEVRIARRVRDGAATRDGAPAARYDDCRHEADAVASAEGDGSLPWGKVRG